MKLQNLHLRDTLSSSLQDLISQTEDIFMSFAREYPNLLKEMEKGIVDTHTAIVCFSSTEAAGCVDDDVNTSLSEVIVSSQKIIRETMEFLGRMEEGDSELFQRLEREIERLQGLNDRIAQIKDDSVEMELISLNAMTVALKAGASGRAFSYITEELKRLSMKIIELTDGVSENGKVITERFVNLKDSMTRLQGYQKEVFDLVNSSMMVTFDGFTEGIRKVAGRMGDLVQEAESVKVPLAKVMEQTQTQDIMRQSLEHVIISVNEMYQIDRISTPEEMLDEMTFFTLMPQLCSAVLDEVTGYIRQSKKEISQNLQKAEDIIGGLDKNRDALVRRFLDQENLEDSLAGHHRKSTEALGQMTKELQEIISKKHSLGNATQGLLKDIQNLNSNFTNFSSLITRFKTIDVASRIEIAKNTVLSRMISTVDEMTNLTQRITHDVENSYNLTTDFLRSSKDTIFRVRVQFDEEEAKVRAQEHRLNEKLKALQLGTEKLESNIRNFSVFSTVFQDLFLRSSQNFGRLDRLISIINDVRGQLQSIQDEAQNARDTLLAEQGLNEWKLQNHKLQDIIQRFTIFSHKKAAGDLAGFEVEEGVEAGEITLF